jgi:hypothetical protein
MKFKVELYDEDGEKLEIENQVIGHILFESEEAIEFFIHSIRICLPSNFQYKVVPEEKSEKINVVGNRTK